ncbi:DUF5686 and carboxypeptidase-like regulatory domain-containing protein [Mucilaginibacter sp. UR6-11]|uniref:DUF5686 and carboxypeptidase-like regulatory domain-containing protein n=1 Tax=Mucilaginibacter sp. UR6-11 TaxID=1435644 RepID=UPI001E321F3B|nr:DUF5686 and carboxypeptidase-like regulatory domain-containing protein [Mucilaginibacter sp. UR6-11]MCC8423500.1 DUF5686 and carboxypeptidase regulatory-like domain-containing protein [Mucilaginibacter sp. UR6-11]
MKIKNRLVSLKTFALLCLSPISQLVIAQQNTPPTDTLITVVTGSVSESTSGRPLAYVNVSFPNSGHGTVTDKQGHFSLSAAGAFSEVSFSTMGYQQVLKAIKPGKVNKITLKLKPSDMQLNEVNITSVKRTKYRNKGNPAVELIQQVIDHKAQNRMEDAGYLQYDEYERIGLSLFNIPQKLLNSRFFSKYRFMLDSTTLINGQKQTTLPGYFSEKLSQYYYRKKPEKTIQILQAEKGINIIKFVDTAGVDIYLNRLYGNHIDIYDNNIFVIVNQFLSPIADHSPNYYKFFITDTVQTAHGKLVALSFTPRTKGDLLFEGKLLVTLDGRYAVQSCELNVNKQININFIRSLKIKLDFEPHADGRYYLTKSDVSADFGLLRNKGIAVFGQRTVSYSNYVLDTPQPDIFYQGKSVQTAVNSGHNDTTYWAAHRLDTLTAQQAGAYSRINRLQNMRSFKTATWIAATITGDFADFGPVQEGPIGSLFSYNTQEGGRFQVGGRTTPQFNKTLYFDGFLGYGTRDNALKYELNTYISLNKTPYYRYPNHYIKAGYLYDVDIPGQSFAANSTQAALGSFQSGSTNYWLYDRIYSFNYVQEFENHFSYNLGFRNWKQQPAGALLFQRNDGANSLVPNLTTSEITLGLRFVAHEQIIQGTRDRHTIHSKYPIYNLQITQGLNGVLNSGYQYTRFDANIYKRFYMSQLGYADITLMGSLITGKVPFPLLNISPANQSIAYDPDAYNKMYYLEFVSDHYVGLNLTQSFNGFFLNKIPLIQHLKWREYLSFKALYGGLRDENNPLKTAGLYRFPAASNGTYGTYGLGSTPYIEAGAGIGNIFKIVRIDLIKRFNYLDHPGISTYSVKLSFSPDF